VEIIDLKKNSTQSQPNQTENDKILAENAKLQESIRLLSSQLLQCQNDTNVKINSNVPNPVIVEVKNQPSVEDLTKIPLLQKATQTLLQSKTVLTLLLPTLGGFGTAVLNYLKLVSFDLLTCSLVLNALFVIATMCSIYFKKIDQAIIRKGVQDLVEISPDVLAGGKSILELIKNQK
jgi:hypothetical protein